MNKDMMKRAMIEYARDQYYRQNVPYSAQQLVSIMNCYARHEDVRVCAKQAGIRPSQAALMYTHFAIALSEKALSSYKGE